MLQAQDGAESITYYVKGFLLGVLLLLLGLCFLIGGGGFAAAIYHPDQDAPVWKKYLIGALVAIPFILLDILLTRYLAGMGYTGE